MPLRLASWAAPLFLFTLSIFAVSPPLAWVRFDDAPQAYQGTKYRFLGDGALEIAFTTPPAPGQVLDLLWGAKNDQRGALLTINDQPLPLRHGGYDGFQWLRVVPPALTGATWSARLTATADQPAFLAAARLGWVDTPLQPPLPSAASNATSRVVPMPLVAVFPAQRAAWDREPATPAADARFRQAERNGRRAAEAFFRAHAQLEGWLAHADPATGLIPRNLRESRYWNGRDAGADNYAFLVLTAAMTDRPLLEGRLLDMLRTEERVTARIDRLPDDFDFATQAWRRPTVDLDATIFDGAEYVKDGLLYVTEWLGDSPWSRRAIGIVEDIWKNARIETPFGVIPTRNFEVNGDLLQVCPRLFAFTGDRKYLEWAIRLGDYYLLGTNHPTRDLPQLALRDHACEVFNGLSELYVAVADAAPEKKKAYAAPLHELYDRLLAIGRNQHGLFYSQVDTRTGKAQGPLTDNWGYNLDGVYTAFLVDGTPAYRDAVRTALGNLKPHYTGQIWEGGSADGYADAIEGALTLLNREPVASAADWIDSEIRTMWAKQRPDGVIEGWHGDGNFSRTSLMYALWKTQGCRVEPWRNDVRVGAVRDGDTLYVTVAADRPWTGRLRFDTPRHREIMKLPLDYPRINQFPEWFTVASDGAYQVEVDGVTARRSAAELRAGLELDLKPGAERRLIITAGPDIRKELP